MLYHYSSVVGVELYVNDLLAVGAIDVDSDNWGV